MTDDIIPARWPAMPHVHALTTTRSGGVSRGPFASFNLAGHVGDDAAAVKENRHRARWRFELPGDPVWLHQVHGVEIVYADDYIAGQDADGGFTETAGTVCAILTADCLPLFLCNDNGTKVGLFHIGWRGLAQGLVRQAVALFARPERALAWLGPAIGSDAFEIGDDVKSTLESALVSTTGCFKPSVNGRWLADLYALTALELEIAGVACSYDRALCTYTDSAQFYSYRRSPCCGRMASMIWMDR